MKSLNSTQQNERGPTTEVWDGQIAGPAFAKDDKKTKVLPPTVSQADLAKLRFSPREQRYDVRMEIARGGMGAVHRVFDRDLERQLAMKILLPEMLRQQINVEGFISEARITSQMEHPNIMPIHDIGYAEDKGLFFTMKLIAGESLHQVVYNISKGKEKYVREYDNHHLLTIFRKVCDAVAFAHAHEVVHRDIKPDNIMVGRYGEVLLMDWGLAHRLGRADDRVIKDRDGDIRGTPFYMAPEQALGKNTAIDRRTDVFLLGATLYHTMTFYPPYMSDNPLEQAIECRIIPPHVRNPARQIPAELERIILKAMSKRPEKRYQSVDEMAADLDAFMGGKVASIYRIFQAGQYLMRAGEMGSEGYMILCGAVDVVQEQDGQENILTQLGPGDIVGEMAVITSQPRSASVIARQTTEVQVITFEQMQAELKKLAPWMGQIVDALAQRLRVANARIHPLLTGSCLYNVVNQLVLLLEMSQGSNPSGVVCDLPAAAVEKRIALDLALPSERVAAILARLGAEGFLQASGNPLILRVDDFELLRGFSDHCRGLALQAEIEDTPQARRFQEAYQNILEAVGTPTIQN